VEVPEGVRVLPSGNPSMMPKRRKGAVFGPLYSSKRYIIHNVNLKNTLRGIVERVFRVKDCTGKLIPPPLPVMDYTKKLSWEFKRLTSYGLLRPLSTAATLPLWKGAKRALYTKAFESLKDKPVCRYDSFLKTFVKCEKIDAEKGDPAPRVIQPRSPRYNLELASYLKPHEHEFYRRIDKMFDKDGRGDKTVFKGVNARETAKHLLLKTSRFSTPAFIGLDASRFDQHVSAHALRWEHMVYKKSFAFGIGKLTQLLEWQVDNIGRAYLPDGKIKYRVEGRRMSGDVNTSLGNCILMCSLVHSFCREKQIQKFALANNGDDCVLIVEKRELRKVDGLTEWFLDMGFNMKREQTLYDLRKVSFCQTNVLTSPGYNLSVRNPNTVTSKDLHSCYPFTHEHQYLEWLIASGTCGRESHQGIPVLEAFYNAFPVGQITDKNIQAQLDNWREYSIVGGSSKVDISAEMRHSFWVAFGITPDCQKALEERFRNVQFGDARGISVDIPYVSLLRGIN